MSAGGCVCTCTSVLEHLALAVTLCPGAPCPRRHPLLAPHFRGGQRGAIGVSVQVFPGCVHSCVRACPSAPPGTCQSFSKLPTHIFCPDLPFKPLTRLFAGPDWYCSFSSCGVENKQLQFFSKLPGERVFLTKQALSQVASQPCPVNGAFPGTCDKGQIVAGLSRGTFCGAAGFTAPVGKKDGRSNVTSHCSDRGPVVF